MPGDTQRSLRVDNTFQRLTFKHVLLPVWIAAYRYNNQVYRFLVNGQTGEVVGKAPWSWIKIALFTLVLAATAFVLYYLFGRTPMSTATDVVGKKIIRVVAAVVENDGLYLITQRRESAVLPNLWEFPGGKVEAGEADEDALKRELRERLDADAKIGRKLGEKVHEYDGYRVALALYEATLVERQAAARQARERFSLGRARPTSTSTRSPTLTSRRWISSSAFRDRTTTHAAQEESRTVVAR